MRTKDQWLAEFDNTMPLCKWFIEKYFGEPAYNYLLQLRKEQNTGLIMEKLNDIWFNLPDSFNIFNGMDEWLKFIGLIEFESEEEIKAVL